MLIQSAAADCRVQTTDKAQFAVQLQGRRG